jgi:hypothetical protein
MSVLHPAEATRLSVAPMMDWTDLGGKALYINDISINFTIM